MMKQIKASSFEDVMKDIMGQPPDLRSEEDIKAELDEIAEDFWGAFVLEEFAAGRLTVHPKRRRSCYLCKKIRDPQFIYKASSYIWVCLDCCRFNKKGIREL